MSLISAAAKHQRRSHGAPGAFEEYLAGALFSLADEWPAARRAYTDMQYMHPPQVRSAA